MNKIFFWSIATVLFLHCAYTVFVTIYFYRDLVGFTSVTGVIETESGSQLVKFKLSYSKIWYSILFIGSSITCVFASYKILLSDDV